MTAYSLFFSRPIIYNKLEGKLKQEIFFILVFFKSWSPFYSATSPKLLFYYFAEYGLLIFIHSFPENWDAFGNLAVLSSQNSVCVCVWDQGWRLKLSEHILYTTVSYLGLSKTGCSILQIWMLTLCYKQILYLILNQSPPILFHISLVPYSIFLIVTCARLIVGFSPENIIAFCYPFNACIKRMTNVKHSRGFRAALWRKPFLTAGWNN